MDDDAVVALVDEVSGTGDVVQTGTLALPVVQLSRVGDEPDVDVVVLGETFDSREHLRDVFRLRLSGRALVIELVVRIDQ